MNIDKLTNKELYQKMLADERENCDYEIEVDDDDAEDEE